MNSNFKNIYMLNEIKCVIIKIDTPITNSNGSIQQKVHVKELGTNKRTSLTLFEDQIQKMKSANQNEIFIFKFGYRLDPYSRYGIKYKNVVSFSCLNTQVSTQ
jgi:hypothetical protein